MQSVAVINSCEDRLGAAAVACGSRPRRVIVLVLGIIVLSLADLIVTLAFLQANWMIEANPIAAYLIRSTQSAWVLAAFKCCTVGICASLLFRVRHHLAGELAAWFAVVILAGMSVMWYSYSTHFENSHDVLLVHANACEGVLGLP